MLDNSVGVEGTVADGRLKYLYFPNLEVLALAPKTELDGCQALVVGHEGARAPCWLARYKNELGRRTRLTGEALVELIGGSYEHEATGVSYNAGLPEHVDGRVNPYFQINTAGYLQNGDLKSNLPGGTRYTLTKYHLGSKAMLQNVLYCFPDHSSGDEYYNSVQVQKPMFGIPNGISGNLFGLFEEKGFPVPRIIDQRDIFVPLLATIAFINGFGVDDEFISHATSSARLVNRNNQQSVVVAGFRRQAATGRVVAPNLHV